MQITASTLPVPTQTEASTVIRSLPWLLLRLEGLVMFGGIIALYAALHFDGWLFLLLLLVPDFSALGYLRNQRFGALSYNLAHTYALPLLVAGMSLAAGWQPGLMLALIWLAHISMDRTVGYGLKYATAFKDTHLQRV